LFKTQRNDTRGKPERAPACCNDERGLGPTASGLPAGATGLRAARGLGRSRSLTRFGAQAIERFGLRSGPAWAVSPASSNSKLRDARAYEHCTPDLLRRHTTMPDTDMHDCARLAQG